MNPGVVYFRDALVYSCIGFHHL